MIHKMKLQGDPFQKITEGSKTIELRLYDEKRQLVQVGDRIEFTNLEDPSQKLLAEVLRLHIYDTFEEMFRTLPAVAMGFSPGETPDPKIMENYYSPEEQATYGAVGIELSVVK